MASKAKMIDNMRKRLERGKKAAVKSRKKRIVKRNHELGGL